MDALRDQVFDFILKGCTRTETHSPLCVLPPAPLPGEARAAKAGGVGSAQQRRSVVAASSSSVTLAVCRACLALRTAASSSSLQGSGGFLASRADGRGRLHGRERTAWFSYLGLSFLHCGGKTRTEARTVCSAFRRPPARIALFSGKWTDSLAVWVSRSRRRRPKYHLVTCPSCGETPINTRLWRLYTCHCCIYKRLCTAPPAAAGTQNQQLLLKETLRTQKLRPGSDRAPPLNKNKTKTNKGVSTSHIGQK